MCVLCVWGKCHSCAHHNLLPLSHFRNRPEDIDRKTFIVIQLEKLAQEKQKGDDPNRQQQIAQRMIQLREYILPRDTYNT
jgi:hypothetical protein